MDTNGSQTAPDNGTSATILPGSQTTDPSSTVPVRRRSLYKANGLPKTAKEARAQRIATDAQVRRRQRQQLILGKRFRALLEDAEESGTESENEVTPHDLYQLKQDLNRPDDQPECLRALKWLSSQLVSPSGMLQEYVLTGDCVPLLLKHIHSDNTSVQLQAMWCVTNVAAGSHALCRKIMDAVPYLVAFLSSLNADLADQAAWAIGNIAAEGPEFREQLVTYGAVEPLVELLRPSSSSQLIQTVCFALSSLARGPSAPLERMFEADVDTKLLKYLSRHESRDVTSEVFWVLAYLTADKPEYIQRLVSSNLINLIVDQIERFQGQGPAAIPLIRTLGNLASVDDGVTDQLLNHPEILDSLLEWAKQTSCRSIKKESLWALSNMTVGSTSHIDHFLAKHGDVILTGIVSHGEFDLRREAAFSVLNIANAGPLYFQRLNLSELTPGFVAFLKTKNIEMVRMALHYLSLLLFDTPNGVTLLKRTPGAIADIETVALSEDSDIRHTAKLLMDKYYGEHLEPETPAPL